MALENNAKQEKRRGRWKPGESGNPGGRPATSKVFRERCREFMERDGGGWEILAQMAMKPGRDQRPAIELLAAYAYGKPTQGVEVSGPSGGPIMLAHLTDEALDEEIRKLME